jgi:uncharacterized Zn ribbon protein
MRVMCLECNTWFYQRHKSHYVCKNCLQENDDVRSVKEQEENYFVAKEIQRQVCFDFDNPHEGQRGNY